MKRITIYVLCALLAIIAPSGAYASADSDRTASYLIATVNNPTVSQVGGEWTVLGLARSDAKIEDEYFERYYSNALSYVIAKEGNLHSRKYTEFSRVILALTAIGKNPGDVGGFNLINYILDYDNTVWQGINGSVWALIALDSGNYGTQDIRQKYVEHILTKAKPNGGWAISESTSDPEADITAMALIALSNYQNLPGVPDAISKGIAILSDLQCENGGYTAYDSEASETAAQVLTALCTLGIRPDDSRFVKNGNSLVDNICSFRKDDGSFSHSSSTNLMATEQCYYALVALERAELGKTPLFDMSDVVADENQKTSSLINSNINIPEITHPGKTFSDITSLPERTAIEKLSERGIINGFDENTFAPSHTVTRAEFAAIIVRALGLPTGGTNKFRDVSDESWYRDYVATAYEFKITGGVSEDLFDPDGTITNEQICVMVARAASLLGAQTERDDIAARNTLAEFTDYTSVSDWAKSGVAYCYEKNIADRSVMEIKPGRAALRSDVAEMIFNLLKGEGLI